MARLLFLPNDDTVLLLQSDLSPDDLVCAVLQGKWSPPALYDIRSRPAFRAVRLGSFVIVAPVEPLSAEGSGQRGAGIMRPLRLSQRQTDVLQALCEGLTDKEIAARLGISPHTITNHIGILKSRLGTRTRAQSISRAVALGLVKMKKRGNGSRS
jgi:NarL family two-component system response regulator LiaR